MHTLLLFNTLWRGENWPARWALGMIVPIYKKTGAVEELDNHRPITLLCIPSKLFEMLLNARLSAWVEKQRALCDEQGGFRSGRGCADQLFVLQEIFSDRRERGLETFAAFLDVKSAYDRVWRTGLWCRLHEVGIRGKPWRMLREMYRQMRRVVLVDGQRTEEFDVEIGLSQGSVPSPLLYSIFIDGLIRHLKMHPAFGVTIAGQRVMALLYADDIALLAGSAEMLQLMLDAAAEYAHQWRFHFNPRKSHVVVQGTRAVVEQARGQQWRLGQHSITTVDEYKYLGVEIGKPLRAGLYTTFSKRLIRTALMRMRDLHVSGCRMDQLDPRCSAKLWLTLVRPILEYGAETWTPNKTQADAFERTQTKFARTVLGCCSSTATVFVNSELGFRSLSARRDVLRLLFWRRLCAAAPERLLSRVFHQRVLDVSKDAEKYKHSLCAAMKETLERYDLIDSELEFEQANSHIVHETQDEWHAAVKTRVMHREHEDRLTEIGRLSTLQLYQREELAPRLGSIASYLIRSRNTEGVWIRSRLRSGTLALLRTLGRRCDPPRTARQSRCTMCPPARIEDNQEVDDSDDDEAAAEDAEHFVTRCRAAPLVQLRLGLIDRLRLAASEWEEAADLKEGADGVDADHPEGPSVGLRRRQAGAVELEALLDEAGAEFNLDLERGPRPVTAAPADTSGAMALRRWTKLILGGETYVSSGCQSLRWPPSLLPLMHAAVHNYLMLIWRARGRLMHGVAALSPDGTGIVFEPYVKFKGIGVR